MANKKPLGAGKSSFDLINPEKLFAVLPIEENSVILDAACGSGAYTLAIAEFCPKGKIFAIDLWEEGINQLIDTIPSTDLHIIPRVGDICSLPLGSNTINICLIATVLHMLIVENSDYWALREIKRVLKSEGILAVIEFKKIYGQPGPPVNIRISPSELDELLVLHGFTPMRNQEIDIGIYNYLSLYKLL